MSKKRKKAKRRYADGSGPGALYPGAEYTEDELEFLRAMQNYIRLQRRPFPSYTEVLAVARALGYRKVGPAGQEPPTSQRD
jgi:hypothetical protein